MATIDQVIEGLSKGNNYFRSDEVIREWLFNQDGTILHQVSTENGGGVQHFDNLSSVCWDRFSKDGWSLWTIFPRNS